MALKRPEAQPQQGAPAPKLQPLAPSATPARGRWDEILRGSVPPEALAAAAANDWDGLSPADYLLRRGLVSQGALLTALGRHYGCAFVLLRRFHPNPAALARVPQDLARRFRVVPLFCLERELYLATVDPMEITAQDFLRRVTGLAIRPVVALPADIDDALKRYYFDRGAAEQAMDAITGGRAEAAAPVQVALPTDDEDAPTIRLINYVLSHAIELGASDIHLEPYGAECVMRFRVDGILHDFPPPPVDMYPSLVSRIKVMSALDISEKRLPQDGRMHFEATGGRCDLRVSIIPGVHGESVVIRVMETGAARQDVSELGFDEDLRLRWERLITRPYGMILVTGPTGSGKSTTLYTTLRRIYSPRRKIITLEDPVESNLRGITQFQINSGVGFTFARGLRSVLRHDPDVIMLGEIRDQESAEIALRSSLTGHLLFSTLHTNDALAAVSRLVDMGIPSFLVLSSLSAVLAQRLLRRLCVECRKPDQPDSVLLAAAGLSALPAGTVIYRPGGCRACGNLGYRGRVGVYQMFEICGRIRRLPPDQLGPEHLLPLAQEQGYKSLRESALEKLFAGVTSLEEVASLVVDD